MDYRIEQLRYQLREDPSSRLFFQLGELLRKEGRPGDAVKILHEGLEKHPRYVAAWVSLGRALLTLGDHDEAEKALERALELDPENGVAARVVGEAAIARGDWLRAVKALKLARGLSPRDRALNERIRYVEARLDERGELVTPSVPIREIVVAGPEREVVSLSVEDPFSVRSPGDTGVWQLGGDVFQAGWVEEEGDLVAEEAPEATLAVDMGDEPLSEEEAPFLETPVDVDAEPQPAEEAPEVAWAVDMADEPPPEVEEVPQAVEETPPVDEGLAQPEEIWTEQEGQEIVLEGDAPTPSETFTEWEETVIEPLPEEPEQRVLEEIPLPTMTLARLAVEQGDQELAEKTLRGLLARDPEHEEAAQLLEDLTATPAEAVASEIPVDRTEATVRALQGWLNGVRLASERLAR
ncbi:MAG: tetratricopeptide repeat protein [Acidobacteria bacterium]|nr:tetratricopeptide repeat protein [Acidobacteriota bacterium]